MSRKRYFESIQLLSTKKILFPKGTSNVPLFITFKIPSSTNPGDYKSDIILKSNDGEKFMIPLNIHVWNIRLPRLRTISVSSNMKSFNKNAIRKTGLKLDGAKLREAATKIFLKYSITPYGYASPNLGKPETWDAALNKIEKPLF